MQPSTAGQIWYCSCEDSQNLDTPNGCLGSILRFGTTFRVLWLLPFAAAEPQKSALLQLFG
jgi:hypothetical protein